MGLGLIISTVIVVLWVDSSYRAARQWRHYRDPRSFGNFLNNLAILAGAFSLLLMSWVLEYAPSAVFGWATFLRAILGGIMLIVGILSWLRWRDAAEPVIER